MSYNAFGGVDISGVFDDQVLKDLQNVRYKVIWVRCFGVDLETGRTIHGLKCECFPRPLMNTIEFLYCENQVSEEKRRDKQMKEAAFYPCPLVYSLDGNKHCECWDREYSCCWCEGFKIGKQLCE